MKIMHAPFTDYAREIRATHRVRRRNRAIAVGGAIAFATLLGLSIGSLAANSGQLIIPIAAVSCWGCWGVNYLLTRH